MGFGVCVIAVLGLHLFGLVASAVRPCNCAYHEPWIPDSPGAMILDKDFLENLRYFCKWIRVCVFYLKGWMLF